LQGDASSEQLEVRVLCGPLYVRREDGELVEPKMWRTGKTADLLRILALSGGTPVPVHVLLESLWPLADEEHSRASLRTAVSQIRKVLSGDSLNRTPDGLVLENAWVDAVSFVSLATEVQRSIRHGNLERALTVAREATALYLSDFQAQDSSADWAWKAAQRLATVHRDLVADAADAALELGQMRDALDYARSSLQLDPWSERAFRAIMQAHAGLGEVDRALRAFETCRRVLRESLGVNPTSRTMDVHHQLLASPRTVARPRCIGRDYEQERVTAAFASCAQLERPLVMTIVGPAGSGRHQLVTESCRRIDARQTNVALRHGANDHSLQQLDSALLPESDGRTPRPSLVVIEDLHLASAGDIERLREFIAALPSPAMVILTARLDGVQRDPTVPLAAGHSLSGEADVRVALAPLPRDDAARLAHEILGAAPTTGLVDTLMSTTGGLPGPMTELLRKWSLGGRVSLSSRGVMLLPPRDPGSSQEPIGPSLVRLHERLTGLELDVARVAACLGRTAKAPVISAVLEGNSPVAVTPHVVRSALDRLVDLDVMELNDAGFSFRQPLLAEALLTWLRPSVRRALHQRVAERAPVPSAERIQHWMAAGEQALACAAALDASDEAMSEGRYEDARQHLQRVVETAQLSDSDPADRVGVFERLGDASSMAQRPLEAGVAYTIAVSISRRSGLGGTDRLTAKREAAGAPHGLPLGTPWVRNTPTSGSDAKSSLDGLGRTSLLGGLSLHPPWGPSENTERVLRDAVTDADVRRDPIQSVEARLLLATLVHTPRHELITSRRWATEALALTVHPGLAAQAILAAELPRALLGDGAAVSERLDEAADLAQRAGDPGLLEQINAVRLLIAHDLDSPGPGPRRGRPVVPEGVALDGAWSWLAVRIYTERGDLERARRADAVHSQPEQTLLTRLLRQLASATMLAETGESDLAVSRLRSLIGEAERSGLFLLLPEAYAKLIVLEGQRDPDLARRYFDRLDQTTAGEGDLPREAVWRLMARAAVRLGHGDVEGAMASATAAADTAEKWSLAHLATRAQKEVQEILRQRPDSSDLPSTGQA